MARGRARHVGIARQKHGDGVTIIIIITIIIAGGLR